MAFPEDPLGLRVEIRAGVWSDITPDVYTRDPITHTRGIRSGGATADPATVPLTINNRDGRYSPRNPMSPLYGLIGRNTPVRISVPISTSYLDVPGERGAGASTPDAPALQITEDLDVRIELAASWYTASPQTLIGTWATGQGSWLVQMEEGELQFFVSDDGTATVGAIADLPVLPERAALRVTLDNTVSSFTARFYWADSITGPWTEFAAPVVNATPEVPFNSTAALVVGSTTSLAPLAGRVYRAEVRSGINGTIIANPDFTTQAAGAAGFTDAAGLPWTVTGTAELRTRRDVFVGEIAAWPQKWVGSGADVWTPVQAAGVLRRYGQGVKAFDSTLRRRIPSGSPIAYWPMEEDREATSAFSPITGVRPAALTGVEFGALDTLPSSRALPKIAAGGTLSAIVPTHTGTGQWQVEFVYNADDKAPTALTELISISATGTVRRWSLQLRAGAVWIYGYSSGGTALVDQGAAIGADVFHGWVRLRLWVRQDGANLTWRLDFQDVGGDAGGIGRTITGTTGRVTAVTATWAAAIEGWGIGHLAVLPTAQNYLYSGSDDGYSGETAWQRISRLASEEGIPVSRIAGELPPQRVGPQRPETLLTLLQKAADADGGMLVESRDRLGLVYRDRSALYTQEPALVLDYAAGQIAAGSLEPTDDDAATRNDVTVSREGGSSWRAVLDEGPLSVQPPPAGIGLYDESVTLAVETDKQLEYLAPWRLYLRTYDGARYPSLTVRLHRHPELIEAVMGLREGDVIRVLNLPPWVAYGPVDLLLTGLTETLLPRTWEVTFTCDPAGPWMVAKANHPVYATVGSDGSVLGGSVITTATTLPVRTTAGPSWTSDPAEMPVHLQVGGEVVRLDAVGQLLNTNPYFDINTAGWAGLSATLSHSTTAIHPKGTASALVVPSGAASASLGQAATSPAVAGLDYTGCYWVYSPAGWSDFRVSIDWYNAGGGQVGTSSSPATVIPAGQRTFLTWTATAPATTTGARVRARQGATPPPSATWHAWGMRLLAPGAGSLATDMFTRTVTGGWGTADTGQAWATAGGAAAERSVNGARGVVTLPTAVSNVRFQTLVSGVQDCEVRCRIQAGQVSTGASLIPAVLLRYVDTSTFYRARLHFGTGGSLFLSVTRDTTTVGATPQIPGTYAANEEFEVRVRIDGHRIRMRAWKVDSPEPGAWQHDVTITDNVIPEGAVGLSASGFATNTNTAPVVRFDAFELADTQVFTVTRSVNGVVKSHAAGAPVSLAHPAIASL